MSAVVEEMTVYKVTGDADCEGRSTYLVGYFIDSHVADVASKNKGAMGTQGRVEPKRCSVVTVLGPEGHRGVSKPEHYILGEHIIIQYEDPAEVRARALAKLSPEERKVLGIKG